MPRRLGMRQSEPNAAPIRPGSGVCASEISRRGDRTTNATARGEDATVEDWTEDDWMEWVEQTYEALDAKDVDAFVAQLTPGATVRFGNGEPVAGRVAIREAFGKFFDAIDSMSHAFTAQLRVDETLVTEEMVTFMRRDGTTVVLPAATVCELTEGKADRMQTYIDVSAVFPHGQAPALCRMREGAIA